MPGYYGTNSTKWLTGITVSGKRSTGAFTTRYYMDRSGVEGDAQATPVWDVKPNAVIVSPANTAEIAREAMEIWGWAWAAEPVMAVEVSADGGASWERAELEPRRDIGWQRFRLAWTPASVGEYIIMARATDVHGNTQPDTPRRNRIHRAVVFVRAG